MDAANIWKSRHDDLLRYYKELRQLYFDATGLSYIPDELVNRYAPTAEDQAYLKSIGIDKL